MENELQLKWARLQQAMCDIQADACLLAADVNLYYLTGGVFNGYFYLPAEGRPLYFIRRPVAEESEGVYYIHKPEQIPALLIAAGLEKPGRLLLEADELSYNEFTRLLNVFVPREKGNASRLLRRQRMIKTPWEVEQLRFSARQHEAVYREIPECYRPGMTDLDFQIEIEYRMRKHGSMGIFRAFGPNMNIFMGSLLAGENAEAPSPFDFALGGSGTHPLNPLGATGMVLEEGITVMADMSGNYTAYQTDMTRVYSIGRLPEKAYRTHQVALDMQAALQADGRPGVSCAEIYDKTLARAQAAGMKDCFMGTKSQAKFVGHGVGLQINELPVLTSRSDDVLQPGMVFAFEPKFVLPQTGAVGIENTFLVTDNGLEKLTCLEERIIRLD